MPVRRNVAGVWALAFLTGLLFYQPFFAGHVATTLGVTAVGALVSLRATVQLVSEVTGGGKKARRRIRKEEESKKKETI